MGAKDLRIVFMGTPEFAVASLQRLVSDGYNVVAVVTTPDKPAGRGQKLHESDVKVAARELGLPILQPERLKAEEFVEAMRALQPDLGIVIAFRMLPEVIWAMPRLGTFNLHASLLPQYRGAAPINWAIINGEQKTGITTFLLNHEIDKGAIINQQEMAILPEDNIGTMYDKLMHAGCDLVVDTVEKIASGNYTPIEQMHIDESTLKPAPKIFKEDCRIDWSWEGRRIVNFVRGLSPYPAAWGTMYKQGAEVGSAKIFEVTFTPKESVDRPGTIYSDMKEKIEVRCADGVIHIHSMQMAGKRRMTNRELLLGLRDIEEYSF
ncbi:MAG: methionyl-tRNA formyltransferase [Alistipes sp.]|nr:methionyl-tRNA formyltransferase [Alistipes sp.]